MAPVGTQYRQGDLLLVAERALPAGLSAVPLATGERLPLVAHGARGGSHLLSSAPGLRAYRQRGGRDSVGWVEVSGGGITLTHDEHAPLTLEPGVWRVVRQREYDPSAPGAGRRRRVAD
jgi:hypothetical protein